MTRKGYDDMGSTGHHRQDHGETGKKRSLETVSMFLWYHLYDWMVENCMHNHIVAYHVMNILIMIQFHIQL